MCDTNIQYFNVIEQNDEQDTKEQCTLIFTPKTFIYDIIWDLSNSIIPFTNGKRYYVYQDLTFHLIDYYEIHFPYIHVRIHNNDSNSLPSILITHIQLQDKHTIIHHTQQIITHYINKKFSLFV